MHTPLIDALRSPGCYPHGVAGVELVETHISWVLLAGDFVYKLKKPLNLGFLDFSTLAKRKFFCEEEIRLNRRTAPDLYLDVVPICGTAEKPVLSGSGEVIEYAVRMRRFGSEAGFDRLLDQRRLDCEHIIDLGRKLADLHRIAAIAGGGSECGAVSAAADPMRDNFTDLADTLKDEPVAAGLGSLQTWTEEQVARLTPVLEARQRGGFIRECHGDAHLGNVALIDGQATLFDCVEFSSELRWIDLMSDLAFAVMDLHSRGESGYAWLLLDAYLEATGDYAGLRLLPLYLVHRALVRAKVTALRLDDPDVDRDALLVQVAGYLDLAARISAEQRAAIVLTVGVSGSGKSWLARQLVERVGVVRVRSDVERKRLHNLDPGDSSGSGIGTGLYSADATARTYHHLVDLARSLVDAGLPALIDAACLKHWQRHLFSGLAAEYRVPFGILHCRAHDAVLRRRIVAREAADEDASEAGLAVLEQQQRTWEPLDDGERRRTLSMNSADRNVGHAAAWIRRLTPLDGVGHITAT